MTGYICPTCGQWVEYGTVHVCPSCKFYYSYPQDKTEAAIKVLQLLASCGFISPGTHDVDKVLGLVKKIKEAL
jgi:hypothetical protein